MGETRGRAAKLSGMIPRVFASSIASSFTALLLLSACGGGGGDQRSQQAAPPPHIGSFSGSIDTTAVDVMTASPSASTPLNVRVSVTATGTLSPAMTSFDMPVTVHRTTLANPPIYAGTLRFALSSGTSASGVWEGVGTVTVAPQPAGTHNFVGTPYPEQVFDLTNSSSDSHASDPVTVAP